MILPDRLRPVGSHLLAESGTNSNLLAPADGYRTRCTDGHGLWPADRNLLNGSHVDYFISSDGAGTVQDDAAALVGAHGFGTRRNGLVIGEREPHGEGLAEQVLLLDVDILADEVELALEQGTEAFFSRHGTQQQDIFAEGW